MGPRHMVIIDLDPHKCPEASSERLANLLHSSPSTRDVTVRIITHFPPAMLTPSPELFLLRSPSLKDLPGIVRFLRKSWLGTFILGVFCGEEDTPADVSQALSYGLDDFLTCSLRDIEVFPRVQRFFQEQKQTMTTPQTQEMKATFHIEGLVGKNDGFLRIIHKLPSVAESEATVLLSGETGTGKELFARAIHYHSPRQDKPFVPVNCGALPDHLVENELFGHIKGAYTDASSPNQGLIAEAEGGTLFLDEVDTLSSSTQVTLLRFLQDYEYRPLGSSRSQTADVRIIAATNTDLQQQVQTKRFRQDLYYRLHIIALRLPPLRERTEDIPILASHFLHRYALHYGRALPRLSVDALHKLMAYPWPGNVRELETVIHRAVILASSPILQSDDMDVPDAYQHAVSETNSFREAKTQVIEQFEKTYLRNLLAAHEGNITHAAKHSGEARRSLQRLLKKYDLDRIGFLP